MALESNAESSASEKVLLRVLAPRVMSDEENEEFWCDIAWVGVSPIRVVFDFLQCML